MMLQLPISQEAASRARSPALPAMIKDHGNRLRMNSNGSGGVAVAASFQSKTKGKAEGSRARRRRVKCSASRAFAHTMTAVAAKTPKKTPAFATIVVPKTCQ
jgi:hypothetical protein